MEQLDYGETVRPIMAFLYSLLAAGRLKQADVEAAVHLIEDLNAERQRELYVDPNLMYYAMSLAQRLLVPLCDHDGPHEDGEWSKAVFN